MDNIIKINTLNIKKYKMLENISIDFNKNTENNNMHIIAGINGSGKTTILEMIYNSFKSTINEDNSVFDIEFCTQDTSQKLVNIGFPVSRIYSSNLYKSDEKDTTLDTVDLANRFKQKSKKDTPPKIIYLEAISNFKYQNRYEYNKDYNFINTINENDILGESELFIREFILIEKDKSLSSNPQQRTQEAIDKFNEYFLDIYFVTKLKDLDIDNNFQPIFENINGELLTIKELSGGEQQLYARVVSLIMLEPNNSIILIDEPEMGLHPKWQKKIINIYQNIGKDNQFIITTHSPHILAQIHYKNLIILYKKDNQIRVKKLQEAPTDNDINNILYDFMDSDYTPKRLKDLHKEYRKYFENNDEDCENAKNIKKEILCFESLDSSFFKDLEFSREFVNN